jgi:RimJ/RimL family protein N-acetyltransferase
VCTSTGGSELIVRPLAEGELDLFLSLPGRAGSWHPQLPYDFFDMLAAGHYRPAWTWVALRGGRLVARAAWWGAPDGEHPSLLDWFDLGTDPDCVEVGAHLLRTANQALRTEDGRRPEYQLFLPADWRAQPELGAAIQDQLAAAGQAGMELLDERRRYEWTPAAGLPERSGRLTFRPVGTADTTQVLAALREISRDSLDLHTVREVGRVGAERAARTQLGGLDGLGGSRSWWRLAFTPGGQLAGIAVPATNFEGAVIGFVGVVPEHRGAGYGRDLLAEATHILAAEGADRIRADTDSTNTPMAAAFERAGYRHFGVQIVMA